MSKLSEQYHALLADTQSVYERGELTDEVREEVKSNYARLDAMKADLDAERDLASRIAAVGSDAKVERDGSKLVIARDMPSMADVIRHSVASNPAFQSLEFDRSDSFLANFAHVVPAVLGEFTSFKHEETPAASAMRNLPMPNAASWYRTYIATGRHAASVQVNEGDPLTSWELETEKVLVQAKTLGAYVRLSVQDFELGDPATFSIAEEDLRQALALTIEHKATEAIEANATVESTLSLSCTAQQFYRALIAGRRIVKRNSGYTPTALFMGEGRFEYIAGLFADDGRPTFPALNPTNAIGQGSLNGLAIPGVSSIVVSEQFDDDFLAFGAPQLMEWYFKPRGIRTEPETVDTLLVKVGISAYFAAQVWDEGLVSYVPA